MFQEAGSPTPPSIKDEIPVMSDVRVDVYTPKITDPSPGVADATHEHTPYTKMLADSDAVPLFDNILAGFFVWMLLAGFVVLPGAFNPLNNAINNSEFHQILSALHRIRKLVAGYACCSIGMIGMCYLWFRWSHNYVWLLSNIFIPGMLNSLSGVLAAFAIIYSDGQGSRYGTTSFITLGVTGGCAVVCGILGAIYWLWKLRPLKLQNDRKRKRANTKEVG
ncbi:hypothetical protein BC827DRAFT_849708 [Russula dissimulans]|nr:hypothetical protein BC827DRAFT_849708 [Russula dissimulans]